MKVLMLKLAAGPERTLQPGIEYDLPDQEANDLINAEAAEAVVKKAKAKAEAEAGIETAALEPAETAMMPRAKRKKRGA